MSIMEVGLNILKKTKRDSILQTELLEEICLKTGCSKESVRGTVAGTSERKLYGHKEVAGQWAYCIGPSRLVRKSRLKKSDTVFRVNYNTEAKVAARAKSFKSLAGRKNANILTMAGENGHCVRQFLSINKNFKIYNCERDQAVRAKFSKTKLPVVSTFAGTIGDAIRESEIKFDFVYYDSVGYACDYINKDFKFINENKKTKEIAITLLDIENFRNTGDFAAWARQKFGKKKRPTLSWLKYTFSNYRLVETFSYNREEEKNSRCMRVFILRLK